MPGLSAPEPAGSSAAAERQSPGGGGPLARLACGALPALAAAGAGVTVLLGLVAGLAWAVLVPQVSLQRVAGGLELDETSGAALFSFDGWYAVVALVGGLVLGVLAIPVARRRGWPVAAATAVAAVLAGLLQWWLGIHLDRGGAAVDGATRTTVRLTLAAHSALAVWPLGACLALVAVSVLAPRLFDGVSRRAAAPGGETVGRDRTDS